jgi:glycosyltransferase involved in cell wall biosynthesis
MTVARIGVLVKTFPKLSETFVLGEVLGLEKLGLELEIFALQRPVDALQHDTIKRVLARVRYLRNGTLLGVVRRLFDSALLMTITPIQYIKTLTSALRRAEGGRGRDFMLACTLARKLRRSGITHLHAHFATQPVAVAELAARLTGIPFSISAHAKDIYLSEPPVLARKMANARFTVTCTDYNRRYLAGIAMPGTAVYGMYHGIDAAKFAPRKAPSSLDDNAGASPLILGDNKRESEQTPLILGHNKRESEQTPLILAVGRLREKKGFATLLRACALLRKAGTEFRCEIVGYGEEQVRLQGLIAELELSAHVQLVGTMNHAALIERYQSAAIFTAPCQVAADGDRDGIPNVMLEAMAMQLAVVATPVSGIPEVVIDGTNGLLVQPEDPRALASALQRLIETPALRQALGAAARRAVLQQFSNDRNLLLLRDLLLNTASAAQPASLAQRAYA